MRHRLTHGDALGVLLVQPGRVELSDQRARAEECRPVALAFFFGKTNNLDTKGQAHASSVQFIHAGHGHEDTQPSVVFATVADGVVVAAGQEVFRAFGSAVVSAHHIAHRVDPDFVETALSHPLTDASGTQAVCLGQVGDGKLALFGKAGIAVAGQFFLPVPHHVAQCRFDAEFVVQANLGDAVDVAQALLPFEVGVALQAAFEGLDDLPLAQARATRATHRQNERPAEPGVVVGIELLDPGELVGCAVGQSRFGLLVGRFRRQGLADHGLAGEFRMGPDQGQLRISSGFAQHHAQGVLEMRQ